jgi:23S rRNA (uracil1939-C5)-methyltransferase
MEAGDEVVVDITALAVGSGSVAVVADSSSPEFGMRGFIRNGVPGDRATVRILKVAKRYFEGEIVSILTEGEHRQQPKCRYAAKCGGCDLQYVREDSQALLKFELVRSSMAVRQLDTSKLHPLVTGAHTQYRRRVILHLNDSGDIGFYRRQSREVVPIRECLQLHPLLGNVLAEMFEWRLSGCAAHILLETDGKKVSVVIRTTEPLLAQQRALLEGLCVHLSAVSRIEENGEVLWTHGDQELELQFPADIAPLYLEAGAFTQVNWEMNSRMVTDVVGLITTPEVRTIWDLFSGAGNFSFPLASRGLEVTAVELSSQLVQAGRRYAHSHGFGVHFHEASVERWLKDWHGRPQKKRGKRGEAPELPSRKAADGDSRKLPDVILADPPRDGLKNCIDLLPRGPRLILISCHLPSFIRDAEMLQRAGRTLKGVYPYDMFPLTNYVELVSVWG